MSHCTAHIQQLLSGVYKPLVRTWYMIAVGNTTLKQTYLKLAFITARMTKFKSRQCAAQSKLF